MTLLIHYCTDHKKMFVTNQQNFNLMKTEKHTTGKILLILSILGLIFLFNTLLFLIEQI